MQGFVKIQSVFNENTERTIDKLEKLYSDENYLKNIISSLISTELNESTIKGKRILLKPNWVKHSARTNDEICLRTHDSFTIAVLEIILSFLPASIVIGDAPIQGCNWDKMITPEFSSKVESLSIQSNIPVLIKDFRRVTFNVSSNQLVTDRNSLDDYLIFDLGKDSYLEPITKAEKNQFRVTHYNPDRFTESHTPGMHKYCITKEMFKADIVISLPKVKTHQKTGITAALKNIVGLNGDKDFLPHHRLGGTEMGGDCYPGKNYLRYWAELTMDQANRKRGSFIYWFLLKCATSLWKLSRPKKTDYFGAGWYGNDTSWRMVMDLNKIVLYGKADGTLSDTPQRQLYSLCDGIVGGQGDGPLKPDPLNLGIVCFTNDSPWADVSLATLMGIEVEKIPLLMSAKMFMSNRVITIFYNGVKQQLDHLKKYAVPAIMSPGWVNYKKGNL